MFPIETATSREIFSLFFPDHESKKHSMDGCSSGRDSIVINCSCRALLDLNENTVRSRTSEKIQAEDGTFTTTCWNMRQVVERLTSLLQVGRPIS